MTSSKAKFLIALWLCMAALVAGPACSSSSSPNVQAGNAAALTNKIDDDHDGKVDESDEGKDDDQDGKVDEANEHRDACEQKQAEAEDSANEPDGSSGDAEHDGDGDKQGKADGGAAEQGDDKGGESGKQHHDDGLDCSDVNVDGGAAPAADGGK